MIQARRFPEIIVRTLVCDEKDIIVAGHKRLLAAQKLGMSHVPVHVARGLTAAQCKAYRLMDNRSNQNSDWDLELLQAEMVDLAGTIDLAATPPMAITKESSGVSRPQGTPTCRILWLSLPVTRSTSWPIIRPSLTEPTGIRTCNQ